MGSRKRRETDRDIYFNNCLHYGREEFVNKGVNVTFLVDRRFIKNEFDIIPFIENEGYEICQYQDKYYLLFKAYFSNLKEQLDIRKDLFEKLLDNDLIISTYDFILYVNL